MTDFPTEQQTAQYFLNLLSDYRLQRLIRSYCYENDVDYRMVTGGGRKQKYVQARHEISSMAKKKGFNLTQIGNALNRDHSTIRHYLKDYTPPTPTRS